ncbi:hypothetical protein HN604_03025 [archaeon]|jgi:hypothetical protein|nr:hypothetical protein [archaeon]MBT6183032.1 hypothetical protein [archaeon]MBT6606501.1 hypothetical protein [archaeon]MBT7251334.1 hypothetical protein [archaeon]MBT7661031.1 hypothetical protein [archaeon]
MKLRVDVTTRRFFISLIALFIFAGSFFVFAYNSGENPAIFGHDGNEIEVTVGGSQMDIETALANPIPSTLNCELISECFSHNAFDACPSPVATYPNHLKGGILCGGNKLAFGGECIETSSGSDVNCNSNSVKTVNTGNSYDINGGWEGRQENIANLNFTVYAICCE